MLEIAWFDEFVRQRLSAGPSPSAWPGPEATRSPAGWSPGSPHAEHEIDWPALDIALLAFDPEDWARHWAERARSSGLDPRRDEPDALTVREARRMLHAWAGSPEERLTVVEVWLRVNSWYPLLAAAIAPIASSLEESRGFEDRRS